MKVKTILVALATFIATFAPFFNTSADAAPAPTPVAHRTTPEGGGHGWCLGKKQRRVDVWGVNRSFMVPISSRNVWVDMRLADQMIYEFCPQGRYEDRIRPYAIGHCWTAVKKKTVFFDGIVSENHISDDNTDIDPSHHTTPNKAGTQNCTTQYLAKASRKVLQMGQDPGWEALGKFRLHVVNDQEYQFFWAHHNPIKYFHPRLDVAVTGWYK